MTPAINEQNIKNCIKLTKPPQPIIFMKLISSTPLTLIAIQKNSQKHIVDFQKFFDSNFLCVLFQ